MTSERVEITWHTPTVARRRGCVVWFTGLSGSGKSTIANAVDGALQQLGIASYLLDGDNVRHGLNASPEILEPLYGPEFARRFGLGFASADREENIRRVGAVAELFCAAGLVTLTALVSPYRRDRQRVRQQVTGGQPDSTDFVEVFVDTPLEVCEGRDPKGLYRKARAGLLKNFTGIDDPYEPPDAPELHLDGTRPLVTLQTEVLGYLRRSGKIPGPAPAA